MMNEPKFIRSWKDIERKVRGELIRIVGKIANENGDTIIYEGMYVARLDRYIILSKARIFKYNVYTRKKEMINAIEFVAVKEDIIGSIEFLTAKPI